MKKYTFSEKVGKKTIKHEIVADTLEDAQAQLTEQLESDRGISIVDVGLPDYVEPIDHPADITLKTYNITYRPDADNHDETETVTYKALSLNSAEGRFINDFPDQAGKYRETHMPLSNYEVDRKNAETVADGDKPQFFANLFNSITTWVKLITVLFISLIAFDFVVSALFGVDGGFGVVTNLTILLGNSNSLSALIVLFLVYYLFIRSGKEET